MPSAVLARAALTAPFASWPIQQGGRTIFGVGWYTKPSAFITQAHTEHGTVAGASLVEAMIDRLLTRYRADVAAAGGLLVVHDWRKVQSFDARLIPFYADRLTVRNKAAIRGIVLAVQLNPLARLAMQAVGGTIARMHGVEVEISPDLAGTLVKYRVQRPDDSLSLE